MPGERCPMLDYQPGLPFVDDEIPDYCRRHCEKAWDEAVSSNSLDGKYDVYPNWSPEECLHAGSIGFSHDAIAVVDEATRRYVVVDECEECGGEFGEQDYRYICKEV